uniref:Uncharacterized protein n=1 Tax=Salmonella sp. TaxID=599 RepID=A0A482EU48_SALSP|nr:hypothetical protein [Salmonella sp.]QBM91344.1 hypothetical protein NNIBIDOC_00011 [Salmonella sp.]
MGFENVDNAFATLISNIFLISTAPPRRKKTLSFLTVHQQSASMWARFTIMRSSFFSSSSLQMPEQENLKTRTLTGMLSHGQYLSRTMDINYISTMISRLTAKKSSRILQADTGMPLAELEYRAIPDV